MDGMGSIDPMLLAVIPWTMSRDVLAQVPTLQPTAVIWKTISNIFALITRARTIIMRIYLATCRGIGTTTSIGIVHRSSVCGSPVIQTLKTRNGHRSVYPGSSFWALRVIVWCYFGFHLACKPPCNRPPSFHLNRLIPSSPG
jgi:hypothetical protein